MIRLVYSNQTEELLAAMAARVKDARREQGLYEPLHIVVPNPNVEAYVKQGLAEELGIAANLKTSFLATLARDMLRDATPGVHVIDRGLFEGQVLSVLLDDRAMAHPELASARAWLRAGGDSVAALDERRFQLAMQLARLFDEYAGSRPDMLDAWPKRLVFEDKTARETETWQRRLWLIVMERLRAREKDDGEPYRLLRDVFKGLSTRGLTLPKSLFVFGFSYFPRAYHAFFDAISKDTTVHLFTLNPCREFWDERAVDLDDMPLVRRWGKPGREHIHVLEEMWGHEREDRFVESKANSLLAHVQNDILARRSDAGEALANDGSILVTRAPSMRREAEEVAAQIWEAIAASEATTRPLRFHEIGVFVNPTQRDAYVSHLATAFRDNHSLPYHFVDLPMSMESRLVEAATGLLHLPTSRFGRGEVLRVLTHPAVAAKYPDANVERWVDLVDALAIMQGKDRSDLAGSYVESDSFNWDQGIKRIVLGAFMDGDSDLPTTIDGSEYAPLAVAPDLRDDAASLAKAARALVDDARELQHTTLSMREWSARLREFFARHLGARDEHEERDLLMCMSAVDDIAHVDLGDQIVSFQIARAFVVGKLEGLGSRRGAYLEGGVVVSSFFPMRAIPFRLVFALGLGEGNFPAPEKRNPLDLRSHHPEPGDVSPHAQDKYLFLETFLCARDGLRLSYVARDEITGDGREPSAVIRDLVTFLHARYGVSKELPDVVPLRRYDSRNVADTSRVLPQEALDEAFVARLREEARKQADSATSIASVRSALKPEARVRFDAALGRGEGAVPLSIARQKVRVSISALRAFLSCPVQGYAKFHIGEGEDEDEEDIRSLENEPFEQKNLHRAPFLRRVFVEAATRSVPWQEILEGDVTRLQRRGEWPTGVFGRAELSRASRILSQWSDALAAMPGVDALRIRAHHIGPSDERDLTSVLHPAWPRTQQLENGATRRVELVGHLSAFDETSSTHFHLVAANGDLENAFKRHKREAALRLSLESALLAAVTKRSSASIQFALVVAAPTEWKHAFVTVKGFAVEEAEAWLDVLLSDLLGTAPSHLLPHEIAFEWVEKPELLMRDKLQDKLDDFASQTRDTEYASFALGPVRRVDELPVAAEAILRSLVERRLMPVLTRRVVES